jgi:hypothetical protein
MTEPTPTTEDRTDEAPPAKPKPGVGPLVRGLLTVAATVTRPFTPTDYGIGQRVEIEGNIYVVDEIKKPEPDWIRRETLVGIRLIEGDGIPHRRTSEEVLDDLRTGETDPHLSGQKS